MKQKLFNILHNPSSVDTCLSSENDQKNALPDEGLSKILLRLDCFSDSGDVLGIADCLESLSDAIPQGLSPILAHGVLKTFNNVLQNLKTLFCQDREIFHLCYHLVNTIKESVLNNKDGEELSQAMGHREWVALEKSVYLLMEWHDQLDPEDDGRVYHS